MKAFSLNSGSLSKIVCPNMYFSYFNLIGDFYLIFEVIAQNIHYPKILPGIFGGVQRGAFGPFPMESR